MGARTYRFHCTDGHAVVIDSGRTVGDESQLWHQAEQAARHVMERYGRALDWTDWIVDVHDAAGRRVMMLAFRDVRELDLAA